MASSNDENQFFLGQADGKEKENIAAALMSTAFVASRRTAAPMTLQQLTSTSLNLIATSTL